MSYPITWCLTPSVTRMNTGFKMAIFIGLRPILEDFKNERIPITNYD